MSKQNHSTHSALRVTLLPKLMSEEVRVEMNNRLEWD